MAITETDFNRLAEGHTIIDGDDQQWLVVDSKDSDGGEVPGVQAVTLQAPDGSRGVFGFFGAIVDEHGNRDPNLNHPSARVAA